MSIRAAVLCVALGFGAVAVPTISSARAYVDIEVAPPAPREEVIPEARAGFVWAPGYWNWSGHKHVWVGGHFIRERRGHHWTQDRWEQNGSHWRFEKGHWD